MLLYYGKPTGCEFNYGKCLLYDTILGGMFSVTPQVDLLIQRRGKFSISTREFLKVMGDLNMISPNNLLEHMRNTVLRTITTMVPLAIHYSRTEFFISSIGCQV